MVCISHCRGAEWPTYLMKTEAKNLLNAKTLPESVYKGSLLGILTMEFRS